MADRTPSAGAESSDAGWMDLLWSRYVEPEPPGVRGTRSADGRLLWRHLYPWCILSRPGACWGAAQSGSEQSASLYPAKGQRPYGGGAAREPKSAREAELPLRDRLSRRPGTPRPDQG